MEKVKKIVKKYVGKDVEELEHVEVFKDMMTAVAESISSVGVTPYLNIFFVAALKKNSEILYESLDSDDQLVVDMLDKMVGGFATRGKRKERAGWLE